MVLAVIAGLQSLALTMMMAGARAPIVLVPAGQDSARTSPTILPTATGVAEDFLFSSFATLLAAMI